MNLRKILSLFMLCSSVMCMAKGESKEQEEKKGSAIITIFSDFHSGFGHVNNDRGFDLDRAYIGYRYKLPHNLEIKAVMDFGHFKEINEYQRVGFIKNALATWKYKNLTLSGGLISTTQFKIQESFWGKRYIMKSFQDEYKFGSSADLGISAEYKFNKIVSADVIVVNGEGYKKLQIDEGVQYGAGLTLTPMKGLIIRGYASYNEAAESLKEGADIPEEIKGITNLAFMTGYKNAHFSIGAEYNYMFNTKYTDGNDKSGISLYSTINLSKNISLYGRWDYLTSKDSWDISADGMNGMAGVEFKLGKYIKLSPNFRIWNPKSDGVKNSCYAYMNASFVL